MDGIDTELTVSKVQLSKHRSCNSLGSLGAIFPTDNDATVSKVIKNRSLHRVQADRIPGCKTLRSDRCR
jgi:hypothetical protein